MNGHIQSAIMLNINDKKGKKKLFKMVLKTFIKINSRE